MTIREEAARARTEHHATLAEYAQLDQDSLEALRLQCPEDDRRRRAYLDLALTLQRRDVKAEIEVLALQAEFFDKAALPMAAAFPVFMTFLASEKVLADPWRTAAVGCSYVVGAVLWMICRWQAFRLGRRAKHGTAELGKVD